MKKLITITFAFILAISYIKPVNAEDTFIPIFETVEVQGVEEGDELTSITITTTGDYMELDGDEFFSNVEYNKIGYHVLDVYLDGNLAKRIHFTIIPDFGEAIGDLNLQVFSDQVTIGLSNPDGVELYVNSKKVESTVTLTRIGTYHAYVIDEFGFYRSYVFTIESSYLNGIDGTELTDSITFEIVKMYKVYVNGNRIDDYTIELSTYGNYIVDIYGINGYHRQYQFTLVMDESSFQDGSVFTTTFTVHKGLSYEMYVDEEEVLKSKIINVIGYHTILVVGVNGYEKEYTILITEPVQTINPFIPVEEFSVKLADVDMTLNGKEYISETKITTVGDYEFIIKGVNGYESSYYFFIRTDFDLEGEYELEYAKTLSYPVKEIYVNRKLVDDGYRIDKTGHYFIELVGEGGYETNYYVIFNNANDDIAPVLNYASISLGSIVIILYSFVLWRRFR